MDAYFEDEFVGQDGPIFEKYKGQQIKCIDTDVNTTFANQGIIGSLNLISAGDAYNNRDSRQVNACGVRIKGFTQNGATIPGTTLELLTLWILLDTIPNGALPTAAAVWSNTGASRFELNWLNRERFRVLYKVVVQSGGSKIGALDELILFNEPITIHFNGTGGAITNVVKNNIIVVAEGYSGSTGVFANFRLFFVDP